MRYTRIFGRGERSRRARQSFLVSAVAAALLAACAPEGTRNPAAASATAPKLAKGLVAASRAGPKKALKDMSILELQEECLAYTAPAEQVVVEQDAKAAGALLKEHPSEYHDYWDTPCANGFQNFTLKLPEAGPVAMRVAPPWGALCGRVNFRPKYPNYEKGGTIFCGERFTPSGERRLVVIGYITTPTPYLYFAPGVDLVALVITPAKGSEVPKDYALGPSEGVWVTNVVVPPPVRIYAGQADAADRTHVTFRYELKGKSDVVDVRLGDDESIAATPRSPLLKRGWGNPPAGSRGMTIRGTEDGGIEVEGP